MPIWNAEKIAGLTDTDLERLAANAARLKGEEVILLCEAELQKRNEIKFANRPQRVSPSKSGSYVSEFHFISPKESGIIRNPDGTCGVVLGLWQKIMQKMP